MQTGDKYDEYLVLEAQRGNQNAYEVLVGGYFGFVCNRVKAYYFAGAERDDVIQEGLIGLVKAIKSYSPDRSSFRTFASVCISRHVISALRFYSRQKYEPLNTYISLCNVTEDFSESVYSDLSEFCRDPEDILINRESLVDMECVIRDTLSKFEYEIFLHQQDGYTYRDISQKLCCSEKSVDNAIQRIRRKLGLVLQGEEKRGILKCTKTRH